MTVLGSSTRAVTLKENVSKMQLIKYKYQSTGDRTGQDFFDPTRPVNSKSTPVERFVTSSVDRLFFAKGFVPCSMHLMKNF